MLPYRLALCGMCMSDDWGQAYARICIQLQTGGNSAICAPIVNSLLCIVRMRRSFVEGGGLTCCLPMATVWCSQNASGRQGSLPRLRHWMGIYGGDTGLPYDTAPYCLYLVTV
jgi:hypothetical protein